MFLGIGQPVAACPPHILQAQNVYVCCGVEVFIDALHHPSHRINILPSQEVHINKYA
jgi:hypothetical protein